MLASLKTVVDSCLVKAEGSDGLILGPELSKAFCKDEGTVWKLVDTGELDTLLGTSLDPNASFADPLNLDEDVAEEDNDDMMLQIS